MLPNLVLSAYKECTSLWQSDLRFWCLLIRSQFGSSAMPYKSCLFRLMSVGKCQRRLVY